jgi:hypothetical protein
MKPAAILTILLTSALTFGQKFEVADVSQSSSPISFDGTAKVSKSGTVCLVTMHNNSTQSLLAVVVSGEVTSPWGMMQSTGLRYDAFFRTSIPPPGGETFDLFGPDFFDFENQGREYINGVLVKPQQPKKDLVCHAAFKVEFVQLEDGSTLGDYEIMKEVLARRAKNMSILTHLLEAYDAGGEAALAAALDEPESMTMADLLKVMSAHSKIPVIDLVRQRLGAAQKRQASGIF